MGSRVSEGASGSAMGAGPARRSRNFTHAKPGMNGLRSASSPDAFRYCGDDVRRSKAELRLRATRSSPSFLRLITRLGSQRAMARQPLKKRKPPAGGLSLGRKRPDKGICELSHRSNFALRRNNVKRDSGRHGRYAISGGRQRSFVGAEKHRGAEINRHAINNCDVEKRRPPVGGPESREETPKEGICSINCTLNILTPNATKAR